MTRAERIRQARADMAESTAIFAFAMDRNTRAIHRLTEALRALAADMREGDEWKPNDAPGADNWKGEEDDEA